MKLNNTLPLNLSVTTLGCKVNQYESEAVTAGLRQLDWNPVDKGGPADLCIINTCTVTHKAAMQSRQAIRKAIREHPDAVIVATGCYAQSEPEAISKIMGVDYIIGNSDKHRIPEIIRHEKKPAADPPLVIQNSIKDRIQFDARKPQAGSQRTRPFIKIQDGCDHFCTYCIVPYTRGSSRSLNPAAVIEQIRYHAEKGAHEVVLTGIHLGRYGLDLSPSTSLMDLLARIHQKDMIDRVRLSSIEPVELTDEIINLTKDSGRICPHFHIPLQSGDETILERMHRPYTPARFRHLVEKIHALMPDAAIGVDVMLGFPGETEEAFENTYGFIEKLPVTYLHVFPFSPRPPAPASRYPDQVSPAVVKARQHRLFDLGHAKKKAFYRKMIGRTLDILIENKPDRVTGLLKGISPNYIKVLAEGPESLKNRIIACRIEKISNHDTVIGTIVG